MIVNELKRPDIINKEQLYFITYQMADGGTAFVAKCDDVPVGALGSMLIPHFYNPNLKVLSELFWYVNPEHRQTRAGIMLLNAFDDLGKEIADEATLSLLTSSQVNSKTFGKRGFVATEYAFSKRYK